MMAVNHAPHIGRLYGHHPDDAERLLDEAGYPRGADGIRFETSILPAVWFRWSPPMHFVSFWEEPLTNLTLFIIPAIVLGMWLSGVTMRLTRTMMLEVLRQDYIRTAWAKGLRERVVVLRHALKNALNPVLTMVGLQLPVLIGGAVVVEHIFNLPGIGSLVVTTLAQRDYTILSALNLMMAAFVLLVNVIIDISYAWLDPRIQYT